MYALYIACLKTSVYINLYVASREIKS